MLDGPEERESNHWWKCKKWAYGNLNRLFVRSVSPLVVRRMVLLTLLQFLQIWKPHFNHQKHIGRRHYLRQIVHYHVRS